VFWLIGKRNNMEIKKNSYHTILVPWRNSHSGPRPLHYRGFMITLRHTTLGRTPLDEWSARRKGFYLTTHNTHKRQTSIPPARLEPTIPASDRLQTHASDRATAGTGYHANCFCTIRSGFSHVVQP